MHTKGSTELPCTVFNAPSPWIKNFVSKVYWKEPLEQMWFGLPSISLFQAMICLISLLKPKKWGAVIESSINAQVL